MTAPDSYLVAVRQLIDELNAASASGLITRHALLLISTVDRLTRSLERRAASRLSPVEGG